MMTEHLKRRVYSEFARIGGALASPARLEILDLLSQGEKAVEEIAGEVGLGIKNASAHLKVLREARLVEARREARNVRYSLADEGVLRLVREVQTLARSRIAEVEQLERRDFDLGPGADPLDLAALRTEVERGEVTLLDVRPVEEFRAGHIPGALSVPPDELEIRLATLPGDRPVVAYCRGRYCAFASRAVEELRRRGRRAERLTIGVPEWRLAGYPVAVGDDDLQSILT